MDHLNSVISVKAKEGVATCLASVLHSTGKVVQFLSDIVIKEVSTVGKTAFCIVLCVLYSFLYFVCFISLVGLFFYVFYKLSLETRLAINSLGIGRNQK